MAREKMQEETYHSPVVQEIMGTVPSWITRWGISVIACLMVVVLVGCYFMRYPETVTASVTIVRDDLETFIGIMHLDSSAIGEVHEGQQVSIKLKTYPYEKDGLLLGEVSHVSDVLDQRVDDISTYCVKVRLPDGLISSYGKPLKYFENMDGEARIVIRNRRLVQHIFHPLSSDESR